MSAFVLKKTKLKLTPQKKIIIWIVFFIISVIVWQNKPEPNVSNSPEHTQQEVIINSTNEKAQPKFPNSETKGVWQGKGAIAE